VEVVVDVDEFERLFRSEYPRLVRSLTLVCGDREVAADVVQDAFVQAHRHWRRVAGYDDPATWVRRVAVNRALNHRRGVRRLGSFVARSGRPDRHRVEAPDIAAEVDLWRAVADLPPQQRHAVALHYLADLPLAEIAAALGIQTGTVKAHLHHARAALADRLGTPTGGSQ
jgi:RNA polymerase sigma-70 factor (ECF subfamily)